MSPFSTSRTTVRLAEALVERLRADPAAQANVSAFVRVVLDSFLAQGAPIASTRAVGLRLGTKVATQPTSLAFPRHVLAHYRRHARAAGGHPFSALIASALVLHYFGRIVAPSISASAIDGTPVAPTVHWRPMLEALAINETRPFTTAHVTTSLVRARQNIFFAARTIRHHRPAYHLTTRLAGETLYVTRMA